MLIKALILGEGLMFYKVEGDVVGVEDMEELDEGVGRGVFFSDFTVKEKGELA